MFICYNRVSICSRCTTFIKKRSVLKET